MTNRIPVPVVARALLLRYKVREEVARSLQNKQSQYRHAEFTDSVDLPYQIDPPMKLFHLDL